MTVIEPDVESFRKPVLATPAGAVREQVGQGHLRQAGRSADRAAAPASPSALVPSRSRRRCASLSHCSRCVTLGVVFRQLNRAARLDRRAGAASCWSGSGSSAGSSRRGGARISASRASPTGCRRRRAWASRSLIQISVVVFGRCWCAIRLRADASAPGTSKSVSAAAHRGLHLRADPGGRRGARSCRPSSRSSRRSAAPLARCPRAEEALPL